MDKNHEEKAKKILEDISYATVATVRPDGKAWNSPVAHEIDADYNIYWFSDKENEHSKNIRNNKSVFIVIYDSTAPEGEGEGVYIEAYAEELNDAEEINKIRNTKKKKVVNDASNFLDNAVRRCYKAVPQRVWINDAEEINGVFIRDYRIEVNLLKT